MITVIGTSPDRSEWAADCLASVPGESLVVSVPGYELAKLQWVVENTILDRFLFVQDSVIVSPGLYERLKAFDGSVALMSDPVQFGCYLGVYERDVLKTVGIPDIRSKREAVEAEIWWTKAYCAEAGDVPVLFSELSDKNAKREVVHHGRNNLVLENDFLIKYKGTWRYEQIVD